MSTNRDQKLLTVLQSRFVANMVRHPGMTWATVEARVLADSKTLRAVRAMEESGGEPDVVDLGGGLSFADCSPESPAGRRGLCYDRKALDGRKENKPKGSAVEAAAEMGIGLLDEAQYRALQRLGEFDRKTSSWIATPAAIRSLGGALFCDRRYGTVFTYHNGAESYYAARGFRGRLAL